MKQNCQFNFMFVMLTFHTVVSLAQSDISMATHCYNRANYNPASISRTDYIYLFSNFRQQWLGVKGAPQVFNVQVSQYFHKIRSAFGISIVNDRIGVVKASNPMISYAFRIAGQRDWTISFGMAAGVFTSNINGSLYEADIVNDPSINYQKETNRQPDFNAGFEFRNTNFILGLSTTHLFSLAKTKAFYLNTNHRYGYLIYKNTHSSIFDYNVGMQLVNRQNLTVLEMNTIFRVKQMTGKVNGNREFFDIGLTLRSSRQMTALFGISVSPNIRIGYAYDHSFISNYYANGTHEIVLDCRIPSKASSTDLQCGDELFQLN